MSGAHHHHHHHGHGHGHHQPVGHGRAFSIGIALNIGFVAVEVAFGLLSGSMALLADAGHNLSDVLSLLIAWGASVMAARPPSARFSYGFKSSSILAAMTNGGLLMLAVGAIFAETVRRMMAPQPVDGALMMAVAGVGIVINTATALLFMRGRKHDINIRGAFLHMAADALVSAGVVLAGLGIILTGRSWIDPVTSLVIVAVIAWGTWDLLKDSFKMGLMGVPEGIDEGEVRAFLGSQPGVHAVHDMHIWPMSTTETAFTAHLVMPSGHPGDEFLHGLAHQLDHRFGIHHATIQIELTSGAECALESEKVV